MDFRPVDRARAEWEKRHAGIVAPTAEDIAGLTGEKKSFMQRLASSTAVRALMVALPVYGFAVSMAPGVGDYNYEAGQTEISAVYTREHVMSSQTTGFLRETRAVNIQKIEVSKDETVVNLDVSRVDRTYFAGLQTGEVEVYSFRLTPEMATQSYLGDNASYFKDALETTGAIRMARHNERQLETRAEAEQSAAAFSAFSREFNEKYQGGIDGAREALRQEQALSHGGVKEVLGINPAAIQMVQQHYTYTQSHGYRTVPDGQSCGMKYSLTWGRYTYQCKPKTRREEIVREHTGTRTVLPAEIQQRLDAGRREHAEAAEAIKQDVRQYTEFERAEGELAKFDNLLQEQSAFAAKFGSITDAQKLVNAQFRDGVLRLSYAFKDAADGKTEVKSGPENYSSFRLVSNQEIATP